MGQRKTFQMFDYDEIKHKIKHIIPTYIGSFKSVQMTLMVPSPFSLIILSSLSTARNREFHLVGFGRSSWREQASSTISAARVDFPHLFQSALHLPNVEGTLSCTPHWMLLSWHQQ